MNAPSLSGFLQTFPEFNTPLYTDQALSIWYEIAQTLVNQKNWGVMYTMGIYWLTAHYLSLNVTNNTHEVEGLLTSNSVDGVNYTINIDAVTSQDGESFNQTKYGTQYWQFAKIRGTKPINALTPRFNQYCVR